MRCFPSHLPRVLLLLLALVCSASAQSVRVTEFLTANVNGIRDEDNSAQGWIEVFNPSVAGKVSLANWRLVAGGNSWTFPNVELPPEERMVIWASGKDRRTATLPLHTSFTLPTTGGAVELLNASGVLISKVDYPQQQPDVSWGRDEVDGAVTATLVGAYANPTPGEKNNYTGPGVASKVAISPSSRAFTGTLSVTISLLSPDPDTVIRYTTNGTMPTPASTVYTAPLTVPTTVMVRARAFKAGLLPGETETNGYLLLDSTTSAFSSPMPIVVLSNFGGGVPPSDGDQNSFLWVWEPAPPDGRARFTNTPTLASRSVIDRRGSSTLGNPKYNLNMEVRKSRDDDDRNVSLLGMPSGSDWVLHAPYNFDRALLRNPFIYSLSNQVGRYATRNRMAEVFVDVTGGALNAPNSSTNDYYGVYNVLEKIRRDKNRVDVAKLDTYDNSVVNRTGGFIWKVDRLDSGDSGFSAGGQSMAYYYPKEVELKTPQREPQRTFLTSYINGFNSALQSPTWNNPAAGYAAWLDVPAAIDHHLLNVWPMNVDALRLSGYWHKQRGGKLVPGLIWDFDRSMESTDSRDDNPSVWRSQVSDMGTDFFNFTWWNRLFQDIEFYQKYIDRWQELRRGAFSPANVNALLDTLNAEITADAIARDLARWGQSKRSWQSPFTGTNFPASQAAEVQRMKDWLQQRANFIDSQWVGPVSPSVASGNVPAGTQVTLSGPAGATIYYTLNGNDPRPFGGGSPNAPGVLTYNGTPITIEATTRVRARAYNQSWLSNPNVLIGANNPPLRSAWGGSVDLRYSTDPLAGPGAIAVSEINFHPDEPTAAELAINPLWGDSDFEFVELRNIGTTTVDLAGVAFTRGVNFTFSGSNAVALVPGARVVVASNPAAFTARYGSNAVVVGPWTGDLANEGERITVRAADDVILLDFTYDDAWYPLTDGAGATLEYVGTSFTPLGYNDAANWRSSSEVNGSPGTAGSGSDGRIVINEILTNSSAPRVDAVELLNRTPDALDVSGWYLSGFSAPKSSAALKQFRIPNGTVIPAGGYVVFTEEQFNPNGAWNPNAGGRGASEFDFDAVHGGNAWLVEANTSGHLLRFVDQVEFGAARVDESLGRWPNGTGALHPMLSRTLLDETSAANPLPGAGAANSAPRVGPLIISEVHHTPQGDHPDLEFIEILNPTAVDQPLANWQLRGDARFDFTTEVVPAGGAIVVTYFAPEDSAKANAFRAHFGAPAGILMTGPNTGSRLEPQGRVVLTRAETPPAAELDFFPQTIEDQTTYASGGAWPLATDGDSLNRIIPAQFGDDPASWNGHFPSPGRTGNGVPEAVADVFHLPISNGAISLDVLANDTDPEDDPLAVVNAGTPSNGTATTDGQLISYVPGPGFNGNDSFTYTISDGTGGTASAIVTLVNAQPVAAPDTWHMPWSGGPLVLDVLANDSDADNDPKSILSTGSALHGTVATDGAKITYTPGATFGGNDSFTYLLSDGHGGTATGTVTLVNTAPVAVSDSAASEGGPVTVDVLANDNDPDGDLLSIVATSNGGAGTVTFSGANVTYTPGGSYVGEDSFTYTVSDGHGGVATGTVTVRATQIITQTIAQTGSAVPGAPGKTFASMQVPAVGEDGILAWVASVKQPGVKGKKQLLMAGQTPSALFGQDDQVPGLGGGVRFGKLGAPVVDGAGRVIFLATIKGPGVGKNNNAAIFATEPGGDTVKVARLAESAPDLPGATFRKFTALDAAGGETLFVARTSGTQATGVWAWDGSVSRLVARTGQSINTSRGGKTIAGVYVLGAVSGSPGHNRSHRAGEVALRLTFTDKTQGIALAVFSNGGWSSTVQALTGEATGFGGTWKSFGPPALGLPGNTVVLGGYGSGGKVTPEAIAILDDDGTTEVLRQNDATPVPGTTFKSFSHPVANAAGAVAFAGRLSGSGINQNNAQRLFLMSAEGDLKVIAAQGQTAPGAGGAVWKKFTSFALPAGGEAAPIFLARMGGSGVTKKNDLGLWAHSSEGTMVLVVRTGQTVTINGVPKTLRKLALLNALPPVQGSGRSFAGDLRIAYLATFSDSTQSIVLVRIP